MRFRIRSLLRLTDSGKKKALGGVLLFAGAAVLINTVPPWIWLAFMGSALVWMGWSMVWQ